MISLDTVTKHYSQLRTDLKAANLKGFPLLAKALAEFLRQRVDLEQAKEQIKRLLDSREERFVELVRTQVYENAKSPYLKLLAIAGCDFSDLRALVRQHGLEGALKCLAQQGVYLTADEFKGKTEIVRGGRAFRLSPQDFDPPLLPTGFMSQSSGTTNKPLQTIMSLDRIAIETYIYGLSFAAHNLLSHSHAIYEAIYPVTSGIKNLLVRTRLGIISDRWFARKIPVNNWLESNYHSFLTYLVVLTGKCFGPGFPAPEFIDTHDVSPIVQWVLAKKRQQKDCCISVAASNGVRIAKTALEMGISLKGTKFILGGEPFTESKRDVIQRSGAKGIPRYSFSGCGNVGQGCAHPLHADEVHMNLHTLAVINHPEPVSHEGPPIYPLLFTTLHPSYSRTLLNVENGDYATLEERDCGCLLGVAGLRLHLHHIRSYEKFTSEGLNYFYGDLFDFLEKTLPREFGGGPGDYQLVEEEDDDGRTRLTLIIHPGINGVNEERVLAKLQNTLSQGVKDHKFMTGIWRDARTFRIRRAPPYASLRGKILPLQLHKKLT